ncbi:MAG TPA: hypothetical protein V6C72_08275 [Chroococcales cyanobacterium]
MALDSAPFQPIVLRVLSLALLILSFSTDEPAALGAPSQSPAAVKVTKEPVAVVHKHFESDLPAHPPFVPLRHREGTTQWLFKCRTEALEYDLLGLRNVQNNFLEATIRVTGVTLVLRLPVTTWYSKKALPDTVLHEEGHVEIVRRVYAGADKIARQSAAAVIGQSFTAVGKNKDDAIIEATKKANRKIYERYREEVADRAAAVTKIYDDLESSHDTKLTPAKSVEEAFHRYSSQSAKKR